MGNMWKKLLKTASSLENVSVYLPSRGFPTTTHQAAWMVTVLIHN